MIENISNREQSEYFVPFERGEVEKVSFVKAQYQNRPSGLFQVSKVEYDSESPTQYYRVLLSKPLSPGQQATIHIYIYLTNVSKPVPAEISQSAKQFLQWTGSQYFNSAYVTSKQETKLVLPNQEVSEFTVLTPKSDDTQEDPKKVGSLLSYGPYELVKPSQKGGQKVSIRYEYTSPVISVSKLSREIEVSHWGGNVAFEEKYSMTNKAAKLESQFSRVEWASTNYYNPPTTAIKSLTYNLRPGVGDIYFTDEIGNVSTSRFRSNFREAHLEIKPRYPVFGGWNFSFTLGWNHDLDGFLRTQPSGNRFILKIPFLEGPHQPIVYDEVNVTVILPEGATDVEYLAPVPIAKAEHFLHKTFMDTAGRTAVRLSVSNVVDVHHHTDLIVTYHLSKFAVLRKPFVIFTALSTVFLFSWVISKIDTRITK